MPKHHQPFIFKHFHLQHHQSPMPIGVDSMLLGSWVDCSNAKTILDIGTGCGLLAFMCAQRNAETRIIGIDISEEAIVEAEENRLSSPWPKRMRFIQKDLLHYKLDNSIDLIISNPPFFDSKNMVSPNEERALARNQIALDLKDIFTFAQSHLSPNGKLALVLPIDAFEKIESLTNHFKLSIHRNCTIFPKANKPAHRMLLEITKSKKPVINSAMKIRTETGAYTDEYKILTQEFYLNA